MNTSELNETPLRKGQGELGTFLSLSLQQQIICTMPRDSSTVGQRTWLK